MNGLELFKTPEDNVFEWRKRDFQKYLRVVKYLVEQFNDIKIEFTDEYVISEEIEPIYATKIKIKEPVKGKMVEKEAFILKPVKDNVVAFMVNGNIRFPVIQILDNRYYALKTDEEKIKLFITTNYGTRPASFEIKPIGEDTPWYYKIKSKLVPVALVLLFKYNSLETFFKDMGVREFEIINKSKLDQDIMNKYYGRNLHMINTDTYLYYEKTTNERLEKVVLKPFLRWLAGKKTTVSIKDFDNFRRKMFRSVSGGMSTQLILQLTLKDAYLGYSVLDVLYDLIMSTKDPEVLLRTSVTDLESKRFRLMEYFLYKLYSEILSMISISKSSAPKTIELEKPLSETFYGDIIQFDNAVNPITQLSVQLRTTYTGRGGFSNKESVPQELRNIHPSYFGVLDPLDTSSGPTAGVVNYLVPDVDLDKLNDK